MFNQNTDTRYDLVLCFFFWCQLFPFGFFLRLVNVDIRWVVSLKPRVLEQTNIGGKHQLFCITNTLVMDTSGIGRAEIAHQTLFHITNEIVFHRMPFFLPLYWSCCSMGSVGRWMGLSVPSIRKSTETHRARTCSRLCGSRSGKHCASPSALSKIGVSL